MTSEPPAPNIQSLTEELERLKNEQAKAMGLAVYAGMSKQELKILPSRDNGISFIAFNHPSPKFYGRY
jgi:hypothetical protein